ncbi:MAG: chromate resistance protein [Deltaproteobacteria bacterium]|nr:chromate resistance protein [Deltaproteobacteria bacterium]
MKWVTRRSIRVNRMATAWLIRRFIDPQAAFLFVEPDEVAEIQQREGARGFDAPGATYPHQDDKGRCSFEALVEGYCPEDVVLREVARIVRGADFPEEISLTPESAGVRAISHGFPLVARDDHEVVEKAAFLYDSLYAALQRQRTEHLST